VSDVPQLDPDTAANLVEKGACLLDVREDDEWVAGHAAAALHIRLADIPGRVGEIPSDAPVVCVCRVGGRSQQAAEFLRARGVDAANLAGGMRAWAAAGLDVMTDEGDPGRVI
jgi:rhodanese-related sulfurtransferase